MILIFPPVAKPCEPPAGVALLSGALRSQGISCRVYDASMDGLMWLVENCMTRETDAWTRRALRQKDAMLAELKTPRGYCNLDRYRQKVFDLNRLVSASVPKERFRITLSDYSDRKLSPLKSRDLLTSARRFSDNPFFNFFEQALAPGIDTFASEYVGISLCYLNQALVAFAMAGWIRARFPGKKILMGGGLISSWMRQPGFDNPFKGLVDTLVEGEGEKALLKLHKRPLADTRQVAPDYDFAPWDSYIAPGKILPFRASIGCYWSKCRFCPEKAEARPYRSSRAGRVMDQLKVLEELYRPEYVHLIDNAITPAMLKALSRTENSFQWYGFARFTKELSDKAFCERLKQSGCSMLNLGLESGDPEVLEKMNKGTDLDLASGALKALHDSGIKTYVYLLFGTEFENRAAADKTLDYVTAHQDYIDYLNLAVFNLPRFSDDAKNLETRAFYDGDLSLYVNFNHPEGWDRKQVKSFIDRSFKRNRTMARIIRRNPPFFTSNHAMFLPAGKDIS